MILLRSGFCVSIFWPNSQSRYCDEHRSAFLALLFNESLYVSREAYREAS